MEDDKKKEAEGNTEGGITAEQLTKMVNSAVTSQLGRYRQKADEQFATISNQMATLVEAVSNQPEPTTKEATSEEQSQVASEYEARMKKMQAEMKKIENNLAERTRQLQEQESQARDQAARGALRDALAEAGVPADRLKQAVGFVYDAEKRVSYDENGELGFSVQESWGVDRLSVSEGAAKFLESDEGKMYLPPRDAGGSGNEGGPAPKTKQRGGGLEDMPMDELLAELGEAMLNS